MQDRTSWVRGLFGRGPLLPAVNAVSLFQLNDTGRSTEMHYIPQPRMRFTHSTTPTLSHGQFDRKTMDGH